jgi:uncharacterized membrane protein YukC
MSQNPRSIPDALRAAWTQATQNVDTLQALAATNRFWRAWADWQRGLVKEAIGKGASWDDVGRVLGTSRQAAWARFKSVSGGKEEGMRDRKELQAEIKQLRARIRDRDTKGKEERKQLRERQRTLDRERANDRRALLQEIQRLRRELRNA